MAAAIVAAAIVYLYPPWTATASRTTSTYQNVEGVAPLVVADTLRWPIAWAPLYDPPRMPFTAEAMRAASARAAAGDASARAELRTMVDGFEDRYDAPPSLRTAGALWRDSILATAGSQTIRYYDVKFAVDNRGVVLRLTVVLVLGSLSWWLVRRRRRDE